MFFLSFHLNIMTLHHKLEFSSFLSLFKVRYLKLGIIEVRIMIAKSVCVLLEIALSCAGNDFHPIRQSMQSENFCSYIWLVVLSPEKTL